MPLNRSPPGIVPPSSAFASPLQHCYSDPNISGLGAESGMSAASSASNITTRSKNSAKRRRAEEGGSDDMSKSEIMDMLLALQKHQDTKLDIVLSSINDMKLSVESMSSKYDEALQKIDALERERNADKSYILCLENRLEILDHKARNTCLEIRNVPQGSKESKEDLKKIIHCTAKLFGIPLQNNDISDVYRVITKSSNKPIIADFTTVSLRDSFLSSYKKYNKQHQINKLNTTNINVVGPCNTVFMSENLTQKERKLYYLAREYAKNNGFTFCWTSFGRIFLRKDEGSAQIRITNEDDLAKLGNK